MEFRKRTIRDVDVTGKIVLVRVDYNVPMKDGKVVEDMRIRASLPTINYLLDNGARKIVLISHLGRPDGEVKPEFSLEAAAGQLSALMPEKFVTFINATTGDKVKNAVNYGIMHVKEDMVEVVERRRSSGLYERETSRHHSP